MRRSSPPAPCSPSTDDVWGEVSAGVNFFNFGTGTTVFAKVDVTFRDDLSGVGGNAGMRWPGRHEKLVMLSASAVLRSARSAS